MSSSTKWAAREAAILRWTISRKKAVAKAVVTFELGFDEACRLYDLSKDELQSWIARYRNKEPLKATWQRDRMFEDAS